MGDEAGIAFGRHVPLLVIIPSGLFYVVRFVGCVVCQVKEERVFLVSLYKLDGIFSRNVRVVSDALVVGIGLNVGQFIVVESPIRIIVRIVGLCCTDEPSVEFVLSLIEGNATIAADPAAVAQSDTIANTATIQPSIPEMGNYWTNADPMGKALANGEINADNAAAQTETWNAGINNSGL